MKIFRKIILFFLVLFIFGEIEAKAENFLALNPRCSTQNFSVSYGQNSPLFDSLPSEEGEAKVLMLAGKGKAFPLMQVPGRHSIWDVTVGLDIPVASWHQGNKVEINRGCWAFGVWFDLHFRTLLDFNEVMQPIVNTGYVFGPVGKLAYGFSDRSRIAFRLSYKHKSDHAGPQYVVVAIDKYGKEFRLIDVNYEFFDYSVSFDHQYSWGLVTHRFSALTAASMGHKGFYSRGVFAHTPVVPSEVNTEPSISLGFTPNKTSGWGPYASYTGTLATTFNYDKTEPQEREKRRYTQNIVVGVRNFSISRGLSPEPVVMILNGTNPHGMFGHQNTYRAVTFGVLVRPLW